VGSGEPDLRNLHLYFTLCEDGDTIMVLRYIFIVCMCACMLVVSNNVKAMSDGIHDNLDALSLGVLPKDLGFPETATWKVLSRSPLSLYVRVLYLAAIAVR
jgi:hypothetical protein